ncbi:uncharacterized protein PV07_06715 [Cladophialophora immunda]|uniref:Secreted protein n=1 Tax=Cladophialophora immunda TaxID=569365 RepID=A0A0D1ZGC5_9EURO|nr:uncharacterized protein PV07_06715 [Cladophialophora immunda]KIW26926.1 hypothetical protein PV07_06715 [Cladophialophora immunda]
MKLLAIWFAYAAGTMAGLKAARLRMRSDCSATPTPRSTLAGVRVSCILHSLPARRLHHRGSARSSCRAIHPTLGTRDRPKAPASSHRDQPPLIDHWCIAEKLPSTFLLSFSLVVLLGRTPGIPCFAGQVGPRHRSSLDPFTLVGTVALRGTVSLAGSQSVQL